MAINEFVSNYFSAQDIELFGFADLSAIPPVERGNFPYGIAFGIPYSREGMLENLHGRPQISYDEYCSYNKRMGDIGIELAEELANLGFKASAQPYHSILPNEDLRSVLPHKTVARLAGLGWIGRCALLVNEHYGSAFRLSVVLTNAPLDCACPLTVSRCAEDCAICKDVCPGHAPTGRIWELGLDRSEFFDAAACNKAAHERARALLSLDHSICALCMSSCPFTRRALEY